MADLPPQGGVRVGSSPDGAGRRGRGEPHNWDKIADWHRGNPHAEVFYEPVKAGTLGILRATYPDIIFKTFATHQRVFANGKTAKVCTVYVIFTGAGNADQTEDDSDQGDVE